MVKPVHFAVATAAVFTLLGGVSTATAATISFSISDVTPGQASSSTDVTLEDVAGGVKFSYAVNDPVNSADLTAVYFNLGNGFAFSGISDISGPAVTKFQGGPTRNIQGGNIGSFFDVGVAIGTATTVYDSFMFTVFGTGLDVTDFLGQTFAVKGMNVGPSPDGGTLGSKNYGTAPDRLPPVPLPAAGWMLLAGVGGLAAMRRRKRKS